MDIFDQNIIHRKKDVKLIVNTLGIPHGTDFADGFAAGWATALALGVGALSSSGAPSDSSPLSPVKLPKRLKHIWTKKNNK